MTLDRFRPVADRILTPFVRGALAVGLTPDVVSVLAFLLAVGAAGAFYLGEVWYLIGAALVFLNGSLDLLDGALARELEVDSPAGDLLDHVLDRYADVVILAGLAAGIERYALGFAAVTGVLLTSYLGTQIEAIGMDREYGGLLGRADRLALISLVAAVASLGPATPGLTIVGWLLVVLAVVGHVTALQRFFGSWRAL
jgi:archaetidylinositol phosphate synthase